MLSRESSHAADRFQDAQANVTRRIVSQTLLIMGASLCHSLSALLPPAHQMTAIIDDVVQEIQRYAHLAPSLRLSADIIREAEDRRRMTLNSPTLACVKL